jgi:hypothetical protein
LADCRIAFFHFLLGFVFLLPLTVRVKTGCLMGCFANSLFVPQQ